MSPDPQLIAYAGERLPDSIALFLAVVLISLVAGDYLAWLIEPVQRLAARNRQKGGTE